MLKTVKRIRQPTQLEVVQKGLNRSGNHTETKMSSLFNIDPYPESGKPPKIDLDLDQLENLE